MRLPPCPPTTLPSLVLLLPSLVASLTIDCADIREDGVKFNLEALDGPHSLYRVQEHPNGIRNTTFSFNICNYLKKKKKVPKEEDCPNGSKVCAIETFENTVEKKEPEIHSVVPIAGEYGHSIGGNLDPVFTRLKGSPSSADKDKEGLRLEIGGGKYEGKKQKAYIEFICIPKKELERRRAADDDEDDEDGDNGEDGGSKGDKSGEETDDGSGGRIKLLSWEDEQEDKSKVLRLEWHTPHACEDGGAAGGSSSNGHWGFFTWFILIVFMGVAAYLIFGSWLNYNRYSARGWDLVPHSDTIRDIPYLLRDWMRRVVDTIQGGGSRGGYSAV